uniref:Protein kinase domain-containing protein n=1 Tax=Heterorhabditis bacteriophora TaxID=37862 RepID=A0A1I7XGH6_HETBA
MRLIGPDLCALLANMPGRMFTLSTTYRIAMQTLERIESLHDIGYLNRLKSIKSLLYLLYYNCIYNTSLIFRDIKAQNFAIGLDHDSSIIYMLDFGLTRKFKYQY